MACPTASPTNPHLPFILSELIRDSRKCLCLLLHNLKYSPNYTAPKQAAPSLSPHHSPSSPIQLQSSSLNEVPHPGPLSSHQKPQHLLHRLPDHADSSALPLVLGGSSRHRVLLSVGCTGIPSCQLLCKPRGDRKREMSAPCPSCTDFLPQIPHVCCCAGAYRVQCLWILETKSNYTTSHVGMDLLQLSGREQARYHS